MEGADQAHAGTCGGELPPEGFQEDADADDFLAGPDPDEGDDGPTPGWIPNAIRMLARTQRAMASRRHKDEDDNGLRSRTISNIRLDEFHGGRSVTPYEYNQWKKSVAVSKELYKLSNTEIAFLIYTQVRGEPTRLLQILDNDDLKGTECHQHGLEYSGCCTRQAGAREDR